ncbi:MAG: hypothetical protein R3F14_23970 [Polyangiaceae bacterium]
MVTAEGEGQWDVVSRFFAPGAGIDRSGDRVGAPSGAFVGAKLGKKSLRCYQASARGRVVRVEAP